MCSSVLYYVAVSVTKCPCLVGAIWCVMRKRASPCWLQLCTVGSYHHCPLRDAHSSRRILRVRRAPRQSLRSVPRNILHSTVMVSAAAGAPGTDAAADALAAVGVNCSSSSSSSELSACWLGCSALVWAPTAWLTARRNCTVSYAPLSKRVTHALMRASFIKFALSLGRRICKPLRRRATSFMLSTLVFCRCPRSAYRFGSETFIRRRRLAWKLSSMLLVRQRLSRTLRGAGPMLRFVTQCRWTYAISFLRLLLWVESESSSPWMSTTASGIACGGNNGRATSVPVLLRHFPVLQILVLQIQLSRYGCAKMVGISIVVQ